MWNLWGRELDCFSELTLHPFRKTQQLGPRNGEGVLAIQMPGAVDTCKGMPQYEVEVHTPIVTCPDKMNSIR